MFEFYSAFASTADHELTPFHIRASQNTQFRDVIEIVKALPRITMGICMTSALSVHIFCGTCQTKP